MKLVVGLGNPGRRYAETRHNVGFRIVERFGVEHAIALDESCFQGRFGRRCIAGDLDVGVLEPLTYMNRSGDAVAEALGSLPVEDVSRDLIVALDDVDLPFGRLRLRPRGGTAGHKGLSDIAERVGHNDFARLRFGVGRPEGALDTADYVLQPFAPAEATELIERLATAAAALHAALVDGVTAAMNRYNSDGAAPTDA